MIRGIGMFSQPYRFWQNRIIASIENKHSEFYQNWLCPIKGSAEEIFYGAAMGRYIRKLSRAKPFHLFSLVEIETINRCNNDCAFCPVNKNHDTRSFKVMSRDLFLSIMRQLEELEYTGSLCLFSNNEPLLDKRIVELHQIARRFLPQSYIYLYTNGKLLTIEKYQKLMTCLDYIIIDNYSDDLTLIDPIKIINDFIINNTDNSYKERTRIQSFRKKAVRSTRGGQAKNRSNLFQRRSLCALPFSQLVIRPDGKLSLCCQDALGKYNLGNLAQQSILDAWNGEEYWKIRNLILKGVHEIDLCRFCDHFHYLFHPFSFRSQYWNKLRRSLKNNSDQ